MARAWIFGNVLGTRTCGTDLDRFAPPCRRVDEPRDTGFTATGVSRRATTLA